MRTSVAVCSFILLPLMLALASQGRAGDVEPVIALHAKEATTRYPTICTTWLPTNVPCSEFDVSAQVGRAYHVYLVGARADSGVAGLSSGLEYNGQLHEGVDIFGFTSCSGGIVFPNSPLDGQDWPASGGGVRITFNPCQNTVLGSDLGHGIAGALYVYAYSQDLLALTPNMNLMTPPELIVANCAGQTTY